MNIEEKLLLKKSELPRRHWRLRLRNWVHKHPAWVWVPLVVVFLYGFLLATERGGERHATGIALQLGVLLISGVLFLVIPSRARVHEMESLYHKICRLTIFSAVCQVYESPDWQKKIYQEALAHYGFEADDSLW